MSEDGVADETGESLESTFKVDTIPANPHLDVTAFPTEEYKLSPKLGSTAIDSRGTKIKTRCISEKEDPDPSPTGVYFTVGREALGHENSSVIPPDNVLPTRIFINVFKLKIDIPMESVCETGPVCMAAIMLEYYDETTVPIL